MATDALRCLGDVADAGYRAVELVGYGDAGFAAVRDRLGQVGLRAMSQHVAYRRLADELDTVIEENLALGCTSVIIQQGRHEDWVDEDAVRSFAATASAWGKACADAGLALGYHGYHELDLEFAPWDNATRWDLFAQETDPNLLFLQLDTYWVTRTGHDPVDLLGRFAGRVPLLHLKDPSPDAGAMAGADALDTTVGDGLLDLPGVLRAARDTGVRWLVIEQEGDPDRALADIAVSRDNVIAALGAFS
jgi:sugar phosphate isomerase/epimerase